MLISDNYISELYHVIFGFIGFINFMIKIFKINGHTISFLTIIS